MQGIIHKLSHKLSNEQRIRADPPKPGFAQRNRRRAESTTHFGARAGSRTLNVGIKRLAPNCVSAPLPYSGYDAVVSARLQMPQRVSRRSCQSEALLSGGNE